MAIGLSVPEGLRGSWPNFAHDSPARSWAVSPSQLILLVEFGSCVFSCLFWDSSHILDKILILGPWFLFVRSTRPWREWTFTWTSQEENKWSSSSKSDHCTKINLSLCCFQKQWHTDPWNYTCLRTKRRKKTPPCNICLLNFALIICLPHGLRS